MFHFVLILKNISTFEHMVELLIALSFAYIITIIGNKAANRIKNRNIYVRSNYNYKNSFPHIDKCSIIR